jgi:hypothetical protein
MSSTAVKVAGLPASGKSAPRSPLAVVPARPVVRQGWFLLAMLATLVMSLLATLLINTALAEGSYERGQLVTESTVLADRQESLTSELSQLRAPAALAQRALTLGMVPAQSAAFVSLERGRVLGVAEAATGEKPFTVITEPTLTPAKAKGGSAAKTAKPSAPASATASPTADVPAKD